MLGDRDYMRHQNEPPLRSAPPRRSGGPSAVIMIIVATVLVYLAQTDAMISRYALVSTAVYHGEYYRLVTPLFLHENLFHIFFNMWGVYLFGSLIEGRMGKWNFLGLYFISGIIGSLIWIATNHSNIPCIGASGAVFGLAVGAMMLYPDLRVMLIFPPIPMKLKTFVIVYILAEVFMELTGSDFKVAHIVHLGGALGGYIYMKAVCSGDIQWDIFPRSRHTRDPYKHPDGWTFHDSGQPTTKPLTSQEIDRILDKISIHGINSLSEEELDTLRKAREQIKR